MVFFFFIQFTQQRLHLMRKCKKLLQHCFHWSTYTCGASRFCYNIKFKQNFSLILNKYSLWICVKSINFQLRFPYSEPTRYLFICLFLALQRNCKSFTQKYNINTTTIVTTSCIMQLHNYITSLFPLTINHFIKHCSTFQCNNELLWTLFFLYFHSSAFCSLEKQKVFHFNCCTSEFVRRNEKLHCIEYVNVINFFFFFFFFNKRKKLYS